MILTAKTIAKLVKSAGGGRGVSRVWARLMMHRHGMVPHVEHCPGGKRFTWTLSQVFGVYLAQFMWRTYSTDPHQMAALLSHLIALGDEQTDATIRAGRSCLMSVGTAVAPELFFKENVTEAADKLRDGLAMVGAEVRCIDIAPMWDELQELVRAAVAEESNVSQ